MLIRKQKCRPSEQQGKYAEGSKHRLRHLQQRCWPAHTACAPGRLHLPPLRARQWLDRPADVILPAALKLENRAHCYLLFFSVLCRQLRRRSGILP